MHVLSATAVRPLRLFACLTLFGCLAGSAFGVGCKITQAAPATEAETAYLHQDYDRAATLYRQQLQKNADDRN